MSKNAIIFCFLCCTNLQAQISKNKIDKNLQQWLNFLTNNYKSRNFNSGNYEQSLLAQDTVVKFTKLIKNTDKQEKEKIISEFLQNEEELQHPLAPYFLEEAQKMPAWKNYFTLNNIDNYFSSRSCPRKRILQKIIASKNNYSKNELHKALDVVSSFKAKNEKYLALLNILRSLYKTKTILDAKTTKHFDEFPHLKISFQEIIPHSEKRATTARISFMLHNKQCSNALKLLKTVKLNFSMFQTFASKTINCYRRINKVKYWYGLRPIMQKKYGFAGWAYATRQIAKLYRKSDKFKSAKRVARSVLLQAKKKKIKQEVDASLYTYAKIQEEEGDFDEAYNSYLQHATDFPASRYQYQSLKKLALISISKSKWNKALPMLEQIKLRQDKLPRDERHADKLGFALLWKGRAYLEAGNTNRAISMWSRLLREFFSSYYGAIAHYMLEKIIGREVNLSPSSPVTFEERIHYDLFSHDEQIQIARSLYLLQLGLNEHAVCEILKHPAKNNGQMFAKSILLHAAGDWVNSVKLFTRISRSYRENLPIGSERILFPKKFEGEIFTYAKKVGIDPFLAMALIRQESLFNPKALSVAGARGLMQIMPKTALYEVRRLHKLYIHKDEKKKIKHEIKRSKNNLFKVSTNIVLGMNYLNHLFQKYEENTVHILSSYNAGITPTNRWRKSFRFNDPMLFINKIPYAETRNYVRLVLRNYFYYKRWYDVKANMPDHLYPVVSKALRSIPFANAKS